MTLPLFDPPSTFDRRALAERLTALAQQDIWIGTSSWKYEGWLGQIYSRDFKLVDQSDMIVSLIPELPGGTPGLSSGVERELHHAFEHTKEVYVVWKPKKSPSPFITETATRIFRSVDEALGYFEKQGYFGEKNLFGN